MPKDNPASANPFDAGVRLLARRPYSVAELRRALRRRFGEETTVNQAIARLRQAGLLDDRKFALQYASFLVRHRAFGPDRIRRELQLKRVGAPAVEAALTQVYEEIPEQQILDRVLDKKLRSIRLPLTVPKFYSLCQSLRRLGFRSDVIMKAMRSRPELDPVAEVVSLDEDGSC
ncbi:MAG TPA: regulatory protein RecX [Terriglobia bacterium]|nr:regulatory protein RecX [Terriglobia bacterium]